MMSMGPAAGAGRGKPEQDMKDKVRRIITEDGKTYAGLPFGADAETVSEMVFNTSMTGYQEIASDPSYTDQAVVMSYPLIGNYGIADEDYESRLLGLGGMIVRDYNDSPSNFRYTKTLSELLEDFGVPGVYGVDTRMLVRNIRDNGARRILITDRDLSAEEGMQLIAGTPVPHDAVSRVSCKKRWYARTANPKVNVVAMDCGIKSNIVRMLGRHGCNVTVVPFDTPAEEIRLMNPDGLFVSNGPGDPEDVRPVIDTLKKLKGSMPIFGICLGHQLLSLAYGASTYKLKFGHRGGNHPVRETGTGRIDMTSQNHGYAVDEKSVENTALTVTHVNLLDGTVEGVECREDRAFSVQYHPESCPGPQDADYLFDRFVRYMTQ